MKKTALIFLFLGFFSSAVTVSGRSQSGELLRAKQTQELHDTRTAGIELRSPETADVDASVNAAEESSSEEFGFELTFFLSMITVIFIMANTRGKTPRSRGALGTRA